MPVEAAHAARNSWAVFLLLLCVMSGASALVATAVGHPSEPPAVAAVVPEWARLTWYGLLIGGGSVSLLGVWWPHRRVVDLVTGLSIERRGTYGLTIGALLYGMALLALDGPVSKVSGVITVGFAVAGAWRIYDIGRDLRRVQDAIRGTP